MARHGDRRKHARLDVPLTVALTELEAGPAYYDEATCANVSTGGLYLVTSNLDSLHVGRRLAIHIRLSTDGEATDTDGTVHWQGEIVRLDRRPRGADGLQRAGVALRFVNGFRLNFPVIR